MKRNRTIEQAKRKRAQRIALRKVRYDKEQARLGVKAVFSDRRSRLNKRYRERYDTHMKKWLRSISKENRPGYAHMYFGVAVWMYRKRNKPIVYSATPKCERARRVTLQQAIYDIAQSF